jgi:hypothetical protein
MRATAWRRPEANLPGLRVEMGVAQVDVQQAGAGMVVSSELFPGVTQNSVAEGGWKPPPAGGKLLAAKGIGMRRIW